MKVVGVAGSPRKGGNTEILIQHTLKAVAEEGLDTELISLAGLDIRPCDGCRSCRKEERCHINDDLFPLYTKIKEAEAMILASPVYYGSATSLLKAFMERVATIGRHRGVFAGKVGGPLAVTRRHGANFTTAQLMFWFHMLGFFMPGSTHPNIAFGSGRGEVSGDEEGMGTAWTFGKNIALLVKKLKT